LAGWASFHLTQASPQNKLEPAAQPREHRESGPASAVDGPPNHDEKQGMAATKSKSAKARSKPKKKTAKGSKAAARSKAAKSPDVARKTSPRKSRKADPPITADVVIKKRAHRPSKQINVLTPLLSQLRAELGPDHQPAWLVDAGAAKLIPINKAGAELFECSPDLVDAVALDQGMPALTTLRKLEKKVSGTKSRRRDHKALLFWTPNGALTRDCQVTAHKVKGRVFFLVQVQDGMAAEEPTQHHTPQIPLVEAQPDAARPDTVRPVRPDPPRDDAAILREIARRIRAGTSSETEIDDVPGELPDPTEDTTPASAPAHDLASTLEVTASHTKTTERAQKFDPHQRAKLAHELRTPISAIIAASEIIKDERLGSLDNFHYRDYARDIHQSARHALELIEQGLKAISYSDTISESTERPAQDTDTSDLNEIVRTAIATIKHMAQKKGVTIAYVASERDACVHANPTTVTQIVLNLLTNAVKFTDSGGSVTGHVLSSLGEDIRVEVRDTGCGMSRLEIERHLEARSEPTPRARAGGGFGIGLSLSRGLADDNGASLEIESEPGVGTTARLSFPLRRLVAV